MAAKSPATRLFVQQFIKFNSIEIITLRTTDPLCGNLSVTGVWKVFLFHHIIIYDFRVYVSYYAQVA